MTKLGSFYMNNMFQWDFLSVHFIQYGQGYMEFEYAQKRIVHLVVVQYGFVLDVYKRQLTSNRLFPILFRIIC